MFFISHELSVVQSFRIASLITQSQDLRLCYAHLVFGCLGEAGCWLEGGVGGNIPANVIVQMATAYIYMH